MRVRNRYKTGCPKCGSDEGYQIKVRALGYNIHTGSWDVEGGDERITDSSNLRLIADRTVKCLDCDHRTLVKNLSFQRSFIP